MAEEKIKIIAENRKARHDFTIYETFEAGISLTGTEVKSLRAGKANMKDSYAQVTRRAEVFVYNLHISPYDHGNIFNHDPLRSRRLLLHRAEINKLIGKVKEKGYALVPLKLYFKHGLVKLELALAVGKKLYDKRDAAAERQAVRLVQFALGHAVAFEEPFFDALHRQIQAPRLAVDAQLHEAAQRRWHAHAVHQCIRQIILHHRSVLNQVVQAQLVKAMVRHALHIVVKLHLEGIARRTQRRHGRQGSIAFGADGDASVLLAVDGDAAFHVGFGCRRINQLIPIVHCDVDGMHIALVKQQVFIAHRMASIALHGFHAPPQKQRCHQHQHCHRHGHAVQALCFQHGYHPI